MLADSKIGLLLTRLACVGLALVAFPASAVDGYYDTGVDSVDVVEYRTSYKQVLVQLTGGINYYIQEPAPGGSCGVSANSMDSVKSVHELAIAAMTSGRKVVIYYYMCGSTRYIINFKIQL